MTELTWTDASISWMRNAARKSRCFQTIAEQIAAYLPPTARVFVAGGGLGDLARWLAYHVEHVTVMEAEPKAAASVREHCPQNVLVMMGDVFSYLPNRQFDALVLCFFGRPNEILPLARELSCGKTFVIQSTEASNGFSLEAQKTHCETILDAEQALRGEGVAYSKVLFEAEHGQPLRSLEEAALFCSHYTGRAVTREEAEPLLTSTGDAEFPFYIPRQKLCMFIFDVAQTKIGLERKNG